MLRSRLCSVIVLIAGAGGCVACGSSEGATDQAVSGTDPSDASAQDDAAPTIDEANEGGAVSPNDDAGDVKTIGDAGAVDGGPSCSKHLTVVFSVGTGAGAVRPLSNGCWTVVDADGAANNAFRKCSASNFVVGNASAVNYAYDDTNPSRALSQDQNFLASCSNGATGDGYEYAAYRGGWRLLSAPHLRAYFAELYGDGLDDIDSFYSQAGVYTGNAQLAAHAGHVFPMINIGPNASSNLQGQIGAATLALCKPIADGGYFGTYVATWPNGMPANDPRAVAFANAMNTCTKK